MNPNTSAVQCLSLIMKAKNLKIDFVLNLVEIVNNSQESARDAIIILEGIFKHQRSNRILIAVQVLEYLIKNCTRYFHEAANKQSFQKSILGLLKRQRGKTSFFKQLSSNIQNWTHIQSRTLYLIQLWYDTFILQQGKFPNIINNYKILRKQNITFPPRNVNQKSLIAVKTQSPIFQNIQSIAQLDKQKFKKKLKALGMTKLSERYQKKEKDKKVIPLIPMKEKQLSIDEISQKIAIIQSQNYDTPTISKIKDEVKYAIEHMKIKPNQQKYWKQVKEAAQRLIQQWEQKNAQYIQQQQQKYLQQKMKGFKRQSCSMYQPFTKNSSSISNILNQKQITNKQSSKSQAIDLLHDDDIENVEQIIDSKFKHNRSEAVNMNIIDWNQYQCQKIQQQNNGICMKKIVQEEINLLDL